MRNKLELKRRNHELYFYKTKNNLEVDFYVKDKGTFIQVCLSLSDKQTYERELKAMQTAMAELSTQRNLILTYNEEINIPTEKGLVEVIPVWKWLLSKEL